MKQVRAWDNNSKRVHGTATIKCESTKKNCNDTSALTETFDFINLFGKILGWNCNYEWTWKNNVRHWFANMLIAFSWTQILGTQFKHFVNGEYERLLEVCALYGGVISVIEFCLFRRTKM